jgi:hypothetical protein
VTGAQTNLRYNRRESWRTIQPKYPICLISTSGIWFVAILFRTTRKHRIRDRSCERSRLFRFHVYFTRICMDRNTVSYSETKWQDAVSIKQYMHHWESDTVSGSDGDCPRDPSDGVHTRAVPRACSSPRRGVGDCTCIIHTDCMYGTYGNSSTYTTSHYIVWI